MPIACLAARMLFATCVFVSPAGLPRTRSVSIQEIYTAILDSARPVDLFWWAPSRAWIGTDGVMMRQSTLDMEDLRKRRSLVITRKEAAEALGVDPRTITTSINEGTIPSVRLGRRVVIPREKFLALFADDTPGRES
ncbi:helix-turn-helix domain-containing protein [Microbacterium sp. H83]|uniref:helix-turn-helix domain-containing protein n=3 Tax=Microbacteriaceae TaxID=85023 RepID=UPI0018D419C1|nr:helix-turn-helix domain-containing protein [Microbacterium sp. H83]